MAFAPGTLQDLISLISNHPFSDKTGKTDEQRIPNCCIRMGNASVAYSLLERLSVLHGIGGCLRDLKGQNVLVFPANSVLGKETRGTPFALHDGTRWYLALSDFGKSLPSDVEVYPSKAALTPTAPVQQPAVRKKRDAKVLNAHVHGHPVCDKPSADVLNGLEQRSKRAKDVAMLQATTPLTPATPGAPSLHEISLRSLDLMTGYFPSQRLETDPPPPAGQTVGRGSKTHSPPESNPKTKQGTMMLKARDYQAGDMWAVGIIILEMVRGNGLIVEFHPEGTHGKEVFATTNETTFWQRFVDKSGKMPEDPDWSDCIDLIRHLCTLAPEERLTVDFGPHAQISDVSRAVLEHSTVLSLSTTRPSAFIPHALLLLRPPSTLRIVASPP